MQVPNYLALVFVLHQLVMSQVKGLNVKTRWAWWSLTYHSIAAAVSGFIVSTRSYEGDGMWTPDESTEMVEFYKWQIALYVFLTIDVTLREKRNRRIDHGRFVAHHAITTVLYVLSMWGGFTRVGALVTLIHDATDIMLHLARVMPNGKLANGTFVAFGVTFIVGRLYVFPRYVLLRTLAAPVGVVSVICNILLLLLMGCSVRWGITIISLIATVLVGGFKQR